MRIERTSRNARRKKILRRFVTHWGKPDLTRMTLRKDDVVHVYGFPARGKRGVFRAVTVGASQVIRDDGELASFELLMVLPRDLGGATFTEVSSFMLDVFAYGLRGDCHLSVGYKFAPTHLAPAAWPTRAVLLAEPTGEPETLATFHVDDLHVDLLWIVPIYAIEYQSIKQHGLDGFFKVDETSKWSLADPHRPPVDLTDSLED